MAMHENHSFVGIILKEVQRDDHEKHDKYELCVSEPQFLLVDVPPTTGTDAKSLAMYFKKKQNYLSSAGLDQPSVVCCFKPKPDAKLVSPAKCKSPELLSKMQQDMFRLEQESILAETCLRVPHLKDAFRLINFWIGRNQPSQTFGAFPPLALHLALTQVCIKEEKMWVKASVLQLFKRALKWIVDSDLETRVVRIGDDNESVSSYNFSDEDFQSAFPINVVWRGVYNITHQVLPSSYRLFKSQAVKALASQEDEESLVMHRGMDSPFERFDLLLRISIPSVPSANHHDAEIWPQLFVRKTEALAEEALVQSTRIHDFGFFHGNDSNVVILGLFINPEQTFRLLDKGPPSEDAEQAAKFRAFWGDLAELRRFKDGSVLESVVWEEHNRRLIPAHMMQHLLHLHVSKQSTVHLVGNALEADNGMRDDAHTLQAIEKFAMLEERIRAVPGLPLQINHISIVDAPSLRYTRSVPAKLFASKSKCINPVALVLLRFETSSRFPKEDEVRKKVESVLLIELAKGLEKKSTSNEEEEALTCFVTSERYMDVLTTDGLVFRVKLVRSGSEREDEVLLHTKLHNLHHSTLFGAPRSFGAVCRLVKRWVSGQRFSSILSDNLIDVMVASMFTQPDPPRSGLCGLFRFFNLLTTFDWKNRALLVNVEDPYLVNFSRKNRADANLFKLRGPTRKGGPPCVVYVFVSKNDDPAVFRDAMEVPHVAWQRICERATASRLFLETLCTMESEEEKYWTALFASDAEEGFDAVLHLDLTAGGRLTFDSTGAGNKKRAKFQNLVPLHMESEALIGFDPLELLLQELRANFGQYAVFFAGEDSDSVGIVWKHKRMPFTIANTKFAQPADEGGGSNELELNANELVHAMAQLGKGIVIGERIL